MAAVDPEKSVPQDHHEGSSSDDEDKLKKVIKSEMLDDAHDPDAGKSDEERAALVRLYKFWLLCVFG
jgi:hypothetical protein